MPGMNFQTRSRAPDCQ
ncbi:hypothetical protein [Otoolea muris]